MTPPPFAGQPAAPAPPPPSDREFDVLARSFLQDALEHHHAGRLDEAKALYRRVLVLDPADADALNLQGVAERWEGDPLHGLRLIARALRVLPGLEAARQNLERALSAVLVLAERAMKAGRADEALALARGARAADPEHGYPVLVEGMALAVRGDLAEAEALLERIATPDGAEETHRGTRRFLAAATRRRAAGPLLGTIVVPVYNMADYVERALDSIAASIRRHREGGGIPGRFRIVVVNDNSADRSPEIAAAWARRRDDPGVETVLIGNPRNVGAGRSRNLGARLAADGRYLWFLDADDFFFEDHLRLCVAALEAVPYAGFVRTGMHFQGVDSEVSAVFRDNAENTYPCNLGIRVACHRFVGGFPEDEMFFPNTADDVAYSRWLTQFFIGVRVGVQTVHYTIRPGNALDIALKEAAGGGPPRGGTGDGPADDRWMAIEMHIRNHTQTLRRKLDDPWDGPTLITDGQPRIVRVAVPGAGA